LIDKNFWKIILFVKFLAPVETPILYYAERKKIFLVGNIYDYHERSVLQFETQTNEEITGLMFHDQFNSQI